MLLLTLFLVTLTLIPAAAHALEMPGKMRLAKDHYFACQRIYYPGFTIAGISEPLSVISTMVLLYLTPREVTAFWLVLIAILGLGAMVVIYWVFVHPVNRVWVQGETLSKSGAEFFAVGQSKEQNAAKEVDWTKSRNQWEYAHLARAACAVLSFVALVIACRQ